MHALSHKTLKGKHGSDLLLSCELLNNKQIGQCKHFNNYYKSYKTRNLTNKLDQGLIKTSLWDGLSTPYRLIKEQWTPTFEFEYTECVYPGCWLLAFG